MRIICSRPSFEGTLLYSEKVERAERFRKSAQMLKRAVSVPIRPMKLDQLHQSQILKVEERYSAGYAATPGKDRRNVEQAPIMAIGLAVVVVALPKGSLSHVSF